MQPSYHFIPLALTFWICFGCLDHGRTGFPFFDPGLDSIRSIEQSHSISSSCTAITDVRVFDGEVMTDPTIVLFENGIILDSRSLPGEECTEIDGTGKFLIPGLIDSHLHIDNTAALETLTSFGITTAINMACYNYTLCASLADLPGLTFVLTATRPVSVPGSPHSRFAPGDAFFQPSDDPYEFVSRESFPNTPATLLKIIAEPGGPSQEQLNALVDAARSQGLLSVMHASALSSFNQAATSATDGIQHIATDESLPPPTIDRICRNRQFVTPTMAIFRIAANDARLGALLGASPDRVLDFSVVSDNVRALHRAGVPLLAGTDAVAVTQLGISIPMGLSLHCELEYLVGAGLAAAEALRAATVLPAELQQLGNRGAVAPGMRADLVLLDADPLVNISNTRSISRVWAGGIEFESTARDLIEMCAGLRMTGI